MLNSSVVRRRPAIVLAALLAALALLVSACSASSTAGKTSGPSKSAGGAGTSSSAPSSTAAKPAVALKPVHIRLLNTDGATYGVGMPLIAYFSRRITSAKELQAKTTVTVNGKAAKGAWYFEFSDANKGYPIEGHYRLENYWPAHAKVFVNIPAKGLAAGSGYGFDDSLTSSWNTGARNIGVVNDSTHKMTITTDGRQYGTFNVSLGAANTPTAHGTKVIMEKGLSVCMKGPGYDECGIKYTQRLTYGGEYLHAAPWNVRNINNGVDSSNGCTNLLPSDAEKLYHFLRVGDVIQYPNANGKKMQLGMGYGDWNVDWGTWQTGGLVSTT